MSSDRHTLLATIRKRIRTLRKNKGWTQTDMAVYLGMNRGHISDIERGKSWATDPRRVREVLDFAYAMSNQPNQPPSGTGLRPREVDSLHCQVNQQWTRQLEDQEGHLLLDLYMECITQGKFRRW